MKKVYVVGTVGLPANYGGWETLVENMVSRLNDRFDFSVYCSKPAYEEKITESDGAKLIYIPLKANGAQSIPYDIISMIHAALFADVILILGVSGCIFLPLLRMFSRKKIITNIDGIEWKRDKWNWFIKKFLKFSERLAVKYSDVIVADNKAIQDYVYSEYDVNSALIEYGGDQALNIDLNSSIGVNKKNKYPFIEDAYAFTVCRIEPENNVHIILEGISVCTKVKYAIVGNWDNSEYGRKLKSKYSQFQHIEILDPIYDPEELGLLRSNSNLYLHGHSCGGTNPSLVEAMNLGLPIIAYDVVYNRETTENKAAYFKSANEITDYLTNSVDFRENQNNMKDIAMRRYRWEIIADSYANLFNSQLNNVESKLGK